MKPAEYAEALYLATQGKTEEAQEQLVQNFIALVRERGHMTLLPRIIYELEVLERTRVTGDVCVVRVASKREVELRKKLIAHDIRALTAEHLPMHATVDTTLIGGYVIAAKGTRIDRSYKRTLIDMYHTLTTSVQTYYDHNYRRKVA